MASALPRVAGTLWNRSFRFSYCGKSQFANDTQAGSLSSSFQEPGVEDWLDNADDVMNLIPTAMRESEIDSN